MANGPARNHDRSTHIVRRHHAGRFGPKAANLARLSQAGLPTPGGFCVDAEAYRTQIRALNLEADARGVFSAEESAQARRHALRMKLGLLDQPITPAVLDPLLAAWGELKRDTGTLTVVRSSALVEDRFGSSFAGQFESFLGIESEADFITAIRSCWGALWATRIALHGHARYRSRRYRHGDPGSAAGFGASVGRGIERIRRGGHDPECDLGARLGDRPG